MILSDITFPEKSTLFIGQTGIGKTKLFNKWILDFGGLKQKSINNYFYDRENTRISFLTEQEIIIALSNLENFESLLRHCQTANYIFLDELFNKYNWDNIKKMDYILSRYYSFWDFLYCNREIKVIGNSNHRITRIFPEIEDSFLRRIDEVFTHVIEL